MPIQAHADTTATTADATGTYQLYDQKTRDQQVAVNKVWDDGLTNDTRRLYSNNSYSYQNYLTITIQTGVPQAALRTYSITYDANGGTFGTDTNGDTITTNTITYNAKNQPTNGTYAEPERAGCVFLGWSISKTATTADSSITLTNAVTDKWMNSRADGSTTTLYAVWKDLRIRYAVMAYGIGIDKDANGNTMGITFGPALGYPEFSSYGGYGGNAGAASQTFTKSHAVSGDATVMSESAPACTDASHSVITGTDAGTDAAGNAYRCLHYDNWNTIIYWNEHDPHVYDKCVPNHCSKTVTITPNSRAIANCTFDPYMSDHNRGLVGDGQSYIVDSAWDRQYDVNITKAGQGYAASQIRAELVGADSHTKLDDMYAGTDALTRYTSESCVLSCFPQNLRSVIAAKALSGVSAASSGKGMTYDVVSNDGVADRLWLFSYGEMTSVVYPSAGFGSDYTYDEKRSSMMYLWWLRSPASSCYARVVPDHGDLIDNTNRVVYYNAVAPGFTLPAPDGSGNG